MFSLWEGGEDAINMDATSSSVAFCVCVWSGGGGWWGVLKVAETQYAVFNLFAFTSQIWVSKPQRGNKRVF